MTNVTYIYHDCFTVRTDRASLVFDFWKEPLESMEILDVTEPGKPLYVFVSHHHKDHFTRKIFEWANVVDNIHFIISNDTFRFCRHIFSGSSVYSGARPSLGSVTVLKRGDAYDDGIIHAEAFGSTDIGNSYYVECCGETFFHAGDLNAWIWPDDDSEGENKKMMGDFRAVLKDLKEKHPSLDYAMFPVDSRLGGEYYTGAKIFLEELDVAHFFPMHFELAENEEELISRRTDAAAVQRYANPSRGEVICLQTPYSSFCKA